MRYTLIISLMLINTALAIKDSDYGEGLKAPNYLEFPPSQDLRFLGTTDSWSGDSDSGSGGCASCGS